MRHFYEFSFYRDNKGRTHTIKKIERFRDEQKYVYLFVMPDNKLMVVTCAELEKWIEGGIMVEFEPKTEYTDAVWREQAMDREWYRTSKIITKV